MSYSTIDKPTDYFNNKLFTGNGGTNAITGVGFQPDFTWIKNRSRVEDNVLYDAVRGVTKRLESNTTDAEDTKSNGLTAFGTDGFTVGSAGQSNYNGDNIASWNWKAGTGQGSSNTDGSINTTYTSANTTAGFSISKYTGTGSNATIGHGLGVAPNVIITKQLTGTQQWNFQNSMMGYSQYMALNTTEPSQATGGAIISSVSSTTYSCDGNSVVNAGSGSTYIAYCFAEKKGYSKFGKYTGNGNADGTFVYLGFKPAFILMKRTDTGNSYDDWFIFDNKRDGFNPNNKKIAPNESSVESSDTGLYDLLSNGFKLRTNNSNNNGSGGNFIYMAFAENPLVGSNFVPTTAR